MEGIITCMTCMFAVALTMGGPIRRQASQSEETVPIGGNVTLLCPFVPDATWVWVYWKKNEHTIYSLQYQNNNPWVNDTRYEGSNHATRLMIKNLQKTDSGIYHCKVATSDTTDFIKEGGQVLLSVTDQEIEYSTTSPDVPFGASTAIPPQPAEDKSTFVALVCMIFILINIITIGLVYKYWQPFKNSLAGFVGASRRLATTSTSTPVPPDSPHCDIRDEAKFVSSETGKTGETGETGVKLLPLVGPVLIDDHSPSVFTKCGQGKLPVGVCQLCEKFFVEDIPTACVHLTFCRRCLEKHGLHDDRGHKVCTRCSGNSDSRNPQWDSHEDIVSLMHLRAQCRRGLLGNCDNPGVNSICQQLHKVLNINESTRSSTCSLAGSSQRTDTGGTKPCLRSGCETCNLVMDVSAVIGPNGNTMFVEGNFTCESKCVIYYINCIRCNKGYVGKTTQKLQDKISQHCRDIIQENSTSSVANHFNLLGHTIEDLKVCVLTRLQDRTSDMKMKEEEKRMMTFVGTIEPHGMNKA